MAGLAVVRRALQRGRRGPVLCSAINIKTEI